MRGWLHGILTLAILFGVSTSQASFFDRFKIFARPAAVKPAAANASRAEDPKCSELFTPSGLPDAVFPYESRVKRMQNGADYFLSEGYSAHVFLSLSPTDKKTVIIKKIYKPNAFGTNRFHFDMEGLKALRANQAVNAEDEASAPFEVSLGERYMEPPIAQDELPQPAARLRFIEGRTVHSLMTDDSLSAELKQTISENYSMKLAELKRRLEKSGDLKSELKIFDEEIRYFFDGKVDGLQMMKGESKSGGPLLIKTDNIVVDPYDLNRMTIVDPY